MTPCLYLFQDYFEMATDRLLDYDLIECVSPFTRRMIDTFVDEFECARPATPKIIWKILDKDNGDFIVNCSSWGDPAPVLTVTLPTNKV